MRPSRVIRASLAAALAGGLILLPASVGGASGTTASAASTAASTLSQRYLVVLAGTQEQGEFASTGSAAAVESLVRAAGGRVATDLRSQIGVVVVESANPALATTLAASPLVDEVGADWRWKGLPDASQATPMQSPTGNNVPEPGDDPGEALQWDMQQIRTDQAHDVQGGIPAVDVGVLDSGIDGNHVDFKKAGVSNVDCARGHNSVTFLPTGPGVGTPDSCTDNQFHGTHVAGTIGMRANGIGLVGVAPNVTLVPVKVCDASGYCYASAVVDGITYSGDQQLDVINMSFFVDDNEFQESTEFKCSSDPTQRAFRHAVERAIQYARNQGVTPVAALGNSDQDLAHPVDEEGQPISNECEVVPAETQGVIGTASLGSRSEKAGYSNYGTGATDVTAPGGNGSTGDCTKTIPSTFPGGAYVCIQGTSMASPHAAGVAALIVSQYGRMGSDGDVKLSPQEVEALMQGSAIDIGLPGYDECFGNGRIDALRAVTEDTSELSDASAPHCPEYAE